MVPPKMVARPTARRTRDCTCVLLHCFPFAQGLNTAERSHLRPLAMSSAVGKARRQKARKAAARPAPMEGSLRILGLGGCLCTVSVDMAAPVAAAQKVIAKSAGIPVGEQQLICRDRELSAHEILGDALGEDDEVTLLRCDAKALATW